VVSVEANMGSCLKRNTNSVCRGAVTELSGGLGSRPCLEFYNFCVFELKRTSNAQKRHWQEVDLR